MVGSTPYAMRRSRGRALGSHGRVVPCRACSNSRSKVCVKYAGPMELWNDALVTPCEGQSRRRLSHPRLSANTDMLRTACFLCVIGHRELLTDRYPCAHNDHPWSLLCALHDTAG